MPVEDLAERDWSGESSAEEAERRHQELRFKMLEKEGKGGTR